jgi:hypothetical protein
LRRPLQVGEDAGDRAWSRVSAIAQIEDKPRISHGVPAESGGSRFILAKKFFYLSE